MVNAMSKKSGLFNFGLRRWPQKKHCRTLTLMFWLFSWPMSLVFFLTNSTNKGKYMTNTGLLLSYSFLLLFPASVHSAKIFSQIPNIPIYFDQHIYFDICFPTSRCCFLTRKASTSPLHICGMWVSFKWLIIFRFCFLLAAPNLKKSFLFPIHLKNLGNMLYTCQRIKISIVTMSFPKAISYSWKLSLIVPLPKTVGCIRLLTLREGP